METRARHWSAVYGTKGDVAVSWFDPEASESFDIVAALIRPGDPVLDVGGGASRLAGRLLDAGLGPVDVLDLSPEALALARARLGSRGDEVGWIEADVTLWRASRRYALWHDRAAFHFLTDLADRAAYVAAMAEALRPGGHAVISTFAEDGPDRCSGLPVVRYAPHALADTLEALAPGAFAPVRSTRHLHVTPGGAGQRFQTSLFRRTQVGA